MTEAQTTILEPIPAHARFLEFSIRDPAQVANRLQALRATLATDLDVVGIGETTALCLDKRVPGLRSFPVYAGRGFSVPATPQALWIWMRGEDRGTVWHRARKLIVLLRPAFNLERNIAAFRHGSGLDLTGFEDGTENPRDEAAVEAVFVSGAQAASDGSSFVAIQQWAHDFDEFDAIAPADQDNLIGRHKIGNEEIDDAPASAHVKRTAQESFSPPAFVLRRSMPWCDDGRAGLVFVAFARSLDPFEALLRRMVGNEDGIADALFTFSRPLTGAYYWCPPLDDGKLDLRLLGL